MNEQVIPLGEKAFLIRLGSEINEQTHAKVVKLLDRLESLSLIGVIEYVPAYCSITVHYDPYRIWKNQGYDQAMAQHHSPKQFLRKQLEQCVDQFQAAYRYVPEIVGKVVEIPVCYGGKYGPDLNEVARYNQLTQDEVVALHTEPSYLVHMLGFAPGFPYLGGMNPKISMPRKAIPRAKIEAGSVGIAGEQTGIYPISTPGGWRIIGRTPLRLFTATQEVPTLIQAGDHVRFIPITQEQFETISQMNWT